MLNPGSVTETFGIAGVREYTHGFKTIAEAIYLRERILRQRQLATAADDADARKALGSFVVGGGFTGLDWLRKDTSSPVRPCASTVGLTPTRCAGR